MRAFLELLAVFAGLYLFDCIHWVRRETAAFRAAWRSRTRLLAGEDVPGNQRHGFVLAQPLLPFGRLFLAQPLPLSLTRDAACSFVSMAANPGPRPSQVGVCVSFDDLPEVTTEGRRVLVGGRLFVEAGSFRSARRLAGLVAELAALAPERRDARIDAVLERSLDVRAVEQRLADFSAVSLRVRACCTVELVLVFAITPAAALTLGLGAVWMPLLGLLVAAQTLVAVAFSRAHRALFPAERSARRGDVILLSLSPPAAMRAVDVLSRDLLDGFHPAAVARVLLAEREFVDFACRILRDAQHPLPIRREGAEPAVAAAAEAWRRRSLAALERFAMQHGVPPEVWQAGPAARDPDCAGWCPRCLQQYTPAVTTCARCWDLGLRPFPGGQAKQEPGEGGWTTATNVASSATSVAKTRGT